MQQRAHQNAHRFFLDSGPEPALHPQRVAILQDKRGQWCADWRDPSGRRHRVACPSYESARAMESSQRATTARSRSAAAWRASLPPVSLSQAARAYLDAHDPAQRGPHARLLRFCGDIGPDLPLASLNPAQLTAYLRSLRARNATPHVLWTWRVLLVAFVNWCAGKNLCAPWPRGAVLRLPRPAPLMNLPEPRALTALLHKARPGLRRALLLCADCGLRSGEMLAARWADLVADHLHVRSEKGGPPRALWLSPRLQADLRRGTLSPQPGHATRDPRDFLIPYHRAYLTRLLHLEQQRAGIPRFRFHDLRHFFATALARSGEPEAVIQHALGHRFPWSVKFYVHLAAVDVTRALKRLHLRRPA